jgi:cytochrome P450
MDALPQVNAFIQETLRWRPISAAGILHKSTQDIAYVSPQCQTALTVVLTLVQGGYVIPKGTVVVANHW